jgi:hypothetical protein
MACNVTRLSMNWMGLAWDKSASSAFIPATGWMSAAGITGGRGWGEIRGRTGNLTVIPAVNLSNDVHDPGASVTNCGPTLSTDGVYDPTGVTALSSGAFRFVRAGWVVQLSAGTTLAAASVGGVVELIQS